MHQFFFEVKVRTEGKLQTPIDDLFAQEIQARRLDAGLLTIWCEDAGVFLLVQAIPDSDKIVGPAGFRNELLLEKTGRCHDATDEPDNASGLRTSSMQSHVSVPIRDGLLPLGNGRRLYCCEHGESRKTRMLLVHFIGEVLPDEAKIMVM